ncbi:MAG TPA: hypothetical protein VFE96_01280, partial [Candidatus Bathyarchaeia archaeon]|nr:hypothetical protein [Candidatus Bathyarchaeia archaeon]
GRDDILSARLFRGTKTFVSDDVWAALDPIVKYHRELAKKGDILSDLERRVLERVKNENSIRTDRLRKRLGLGSKENNYKFHRALVNLEKYLLIVGVEDPVPEKHLHANIWQTWQDRTRKRTGKASLTYREALAELVKKTLDSCVLAREDQIGRWFHWHADVGAIVQELLRKEAILKAGSYLLTSRISAS